MIIRYLAFDEGGDRDVVKKVSKVLPDIGRPVLPQTLVVEPVHLRDLPRLVVPSKDGDPARVPDLQGNQHCHRLHRVEASVYIVAHE